METTDRETSEPLGRALAIARGIVQRAIWMFEDVGVFSPPDLSDLSDVCRRGATLYEQILHGVSPLSGSRDEARRGAPEEMTKALVGAVFPAVRKVEDLVRTACDGAGFPVHYAERAGGGGPGDWLWMDLSRLEDALEDHRIPPDESPSTVLGRILDTLAQIEARLAAPQPFPLPEVRIAVDDPGTMPRQFEPAAASSREECADTTPIERPSVTPPLVEPPKEAFAAYHLHKLARMRQKEIAAKLTKQFGRPIKQPEISRMCKKVATFLGAGGAAPDWPAYNRQPGGRVRPMDPRDLEAMGSSDPAPEHRTGDAEEGVGESYAP